MSYESEGLRTQAARLAISSRNRGDIDAAEMFSIRAAQFLEEATIVERATGEAPEPQPQPQAVVQQQQQPQPKKDED